MIPNFIAISKRAVVILAAVAAVLIPGTATAQSLESLFGGAFELVDHTGKTRRDTDFRGRFMLVFFGYANCPIVCPSDLGVIAAALDQAGDAGGRVQPLFITVDPERDTTAVLADHVRRIHPRLIGLTGDADAVKQARKAYRVGAERIADPDGGDYLVGHTPTTFLMGPDGAFLTLFPHGTPPDRMAAAIRKYAGGA